jgi:YggT family protein
MIATIFNILSGITSIYMLLIFFRILLSWINPYQLGRPLEILGSITDPYLNWFQRFPLRMGIMDFSPILALGILSVVNTVFNTIARSGYLSLGIILAMIASVAWSALSFVLGFVIIILILRIIAYFTNRNIFSGFWRIIDSIASPIIHAITGLVFRRRSVQYSTGLLTSTGVVLVLRIAAGFAVNLGINLLARLPF